MSAARRTAFIAATVLVGIVVAAGVRSAGFLVGAIDVQGARRVSPDAIRQVLGTRVGSEFDPARIRDDVKAVYRMGYFSDVRIDAEETAGGYRLTVIVVEKPIVAQAAIEGNKEVDTTDLRQAMTLKERTLFQEEKVKESARKMIEVYRNKGFYDAAIDHSTSTEADGSIRVTFRVTEGEKLKIASIRFAGNHYMTSKAIRKVMEIGTKGFFSFITDSGTFKKDVLDADIKRIEALYQNDGFLDSKISDPEIRRGRKGLDVTIRVFEGKQYRAGEVRFSGETDVPEEELRKLVKIRKTGIMNRETILMDLLSLTTKLNDQGYAQAVVTPDISKRKEYPVADVTYRLERGDKFRFGRVDVSGNTKTLDRVVRRNLEVSDGHTYTASGLKSSKENLARLGYFKDVKISTAPAKTPGLMDVKVEVQEGPTGTLSGGLGFSSVDKLFGVVQVSENNLFGRGWKASLNSQFGARRTVFSLEFRDPHFLDTDYSLLLNAYNTRVLYPDFERRARGGKVGLGYNLDKFTNAGLTFRDDRVRVSDVGNAASTFLKEEFGKGWQTTRSLTFNVTRNTTDKFLDPSRGTVASGSVEYAGGPLGGDTDFVKYFLNGKVYFPVTSSTILSGNLLWGHIVSTVNGPVPIFERFFLGGPYSIRGFRSRHLSPLDPNTKEAIGGNKELLMNAEWQIPLYGEIGFRGVLFFDAGNAWAQGEWPWNMEPWNGPAIRTATGFGVRWYSPMGPLRFEWGFNLNPQPGEPKRVTEFTIGTVF